MKNKKTFRIILLIILNICILSNIAFAAINLSSIINNDGSVAGGAQITTAGSIVLTLVTTVGIFVSVIILAFIGIKYMIGSAEEKATYKRSMIPYVIGALLVFGASGITKIAISIF